jgi:hypothetical protein
MSVKQEKVPPIYYDRGNVIFYEPEPLAPQGWFALLFTHKSLSFCASTCGVGGGRFYKNAIHKSPFQGKASSGVKRSCCREKGNEEDKKPPLSLQF